ncbi:hypothetical protein SNEBB_000311 [Seison nebaliae]|nr:hypothetical protein SNEBB_000311 [Seison nebaliae]
MSRNNIPTTNTSSMSTSTMSTKELLPQYQGTLWKWTNYWGLWQPRWFALRNNVLSYYLNQSEQESGCRGSIQLEGGELRSHSADPLRFDILIPSENNNGYCLKAANTKERQIWLTVLGSSKLQASNVKFVESRITPAILPLTNNNNDMPKVHQSTSPLTVATTTMMSSGNGKDNESKKSALSYLSPTNVEQSVTDQLITLKKREDELRIYSQQLARDIKKLKESVVDEAQVDVKLLDKQICSIGDTCDVFVNCIEDCVEIIHNERAQLHLHISAPYHRSDSPNSVRTSIDTIINLKSNKEKKNEENEENRKDEDKEENITLYQSAETRRIEELRQLNLPYIKNFFNGRLQSFKLVLKTDDPNKTRIDTQLFFDAIGKLVEVFDIFQTVSVVPIQSDINGNVKKLQVFTEKNPQRYEHDLFDLVRDEMEKNTQFNANSATDAILWLKRTLRFLHSLLHSFTEGVFDDHIKQSIQSLTLKQCAQKAYTSVLKPYHNWITRSVFSIAFNSLPYRDDFLQRLLIDEIPEGEKQLFVEQSICRDILMFCEELHPLLLELDEFYLKNDLESRDILT